MANVPGDQLEPRGHGWFADHDMSPIAEGADDAAKGLPAGSWEKRVSRIVWSGGGDGKRQTRENDRGSEGEK